MDEAGRGPVIGPLVMAGVLVEEINHSKLESLGVKDSKLLTALKREGLYTKILEIVDDYKITVLEPEIIDTALKTAHLNLNWLEANASAEIINSLNPDKAIIDCPSNNITTYREYILNLLKNKNINLILEHKAEKYPTVAAASILAKVTRDRIINDLKKKIGIDFGSGYMTDKKTQDFLKKYYDKYDNIFRKTWASYKQVFQKSIGEF